MKKIVGIFVGIISGICVFVVFESWIIAIVAIFGFLHSILILFAINILLGIVINHFYNYQNDILVKWITKQEAKVAKINLILEKIIKLSKILALLVSGVTIGPLPTICFTRLLGYIKQDASWFVLVNSFLFAVVWSLIYSGVFKCIITIMK